VTFRSALLDWPLRAKLAILLIVASVLPLSIAAYFDIRGARERMNASAADLLVARGHQLVDELDAFHVTHIRSAETCARLPGVIAFSSASGSDANSLRSVARSILDVQRATDPTIRCAAILDRSGTVVEATEDALIGRNLVSRDHVRSALTGATVVSDIHISEPEAGSVPSIAYLTSIPGPDLRMLGVLVLWVRAGALWDIMKASNELAGPQSFAALLDHLGIRIGHSGDDDSVFRPAGNLDPATIERLVAEQRFGAKTRELLEDVRAFPEEFDRSRAEWLSPETFSGLAPFNQQWNLGVGHRLRTVPWTVFHMIPEESLLARNAPLTSTKIAFASVIILFALLAGTGFAAVILLRPIRALSTTTEALAAGDLSARVQLSRSDELGRLSMTFNAMADRIQLQALELQRANEELELKVEQRTSDLMQATETLEVEVCVRRMAEELLRVSEQSLATTLHSIGDAVIATDLDGQVVRMNPVAERLTGWSLTEARGRPFDEVFHILDEDTRRPVESPAARVLRDGLVVGLASHTTLVARDGTERPIADSGAPIRDARGQLKGVVLVFRDQSEDREQEAVRINSIRLEAQNRQIQEANRLKSEFLANMSHELRTPLNAIIGFAELIHDGVVRPDTPQHKEFMLDILTSSRHLLSLINDVLDLAKVESGKLEFRSEPVDLSNPITEVLGILRTTAAEKHISVVSEVDASLSDVVLDSSRLKQVLYNYTSNALKFTPNGGRIIVRALPGPEAAMFSLEVEDSGIGISAENVGRLFVEFQQLDTGTSKTHSGTGLGLALTKRLVEAQGGRVGVRSVLGQGSTFYAVLPRRPLVGVPAPRSRSFDSTRRGAPRILVIEDDERDQEVLVRTLTNAGYGVMTASSGAQALALSREHAYDAITLDLLMPDMTGIDVLERIRADGHNRDVPVIVVTVVAERGVLAGFAVHDLLPKPLEGAALLKSLERSGIHPARSGSVLVVDDDMGSLRLMSASLDRLGYSSVCVQHGEDGLRSARVSPPSAVVLDLLMPEMNGLQFLSQFRLLPNCRFVPVIVWTAKDLSDIEISELRATVQGVIAKRGSGSLIVGELRACLTNSAERDDPESVSP